MFGKHNTYKTNKYDTKRMPVIQIFVLLMLTSCNAHNKHADLHENTDWPIESGKIECKEIQGYPTFCFDASAKQKDRLIVVEYRNGQLTKRKEELLKLEKSGKWQTHVYRDTVKMGHQYEIALIRNSDTILTARLSDIIIGPQGVYRRSICALLSYKMNGNVKDKELANMYEIEDGGRNLTRNEKNEF